MPNENTAWSIIIAQHTKENQYDIHLMAFYMIIISVGIIAVVLYKMS